MAEAAPVIPLSTRAKESIKVALAMTIAYAIALSMGWEKPAWAAISVAMVSLDTTGASLNKAALRMLGTVIAGVMALTFLALFPQDRWVMIVCLSLYIGLCVYMLTGDRYQYFWFVSAFVTMVIIIQSTPADSLRAFQITVARVEETGMGILVYSLISTFLWPRSTRGDLETASRELSATQGELYRRYRGLMTGQGAADAIRPVQMREVGLVTRVGQALTAAETDSYAVRELHRQWRQFHRLSTDLMETLAHWRETFPQLRDIELSKPLPNLDALLSELDLRFAEVESLLAGEEPKRPAEAITLRIDRTEVRVLGGHFEKAAIAVAKAQLDHLEVLSRSLLDVVRDIRGYRREAAEAAAEAARQRWLKIDPDRFAAATTVMTTLWAGYLIWIYVDPPAHSLFVFETTLWAMIAVMSRVSPTALVPAMLIGIVLGGVVYVFVMPHLSGYGQLGPMIFGVTFAIFYLCWVPHLRPMSPVILAIFNILIFIDNQQSYDFTIFANSALGLLLSLGLTIVIAYIPTSPRPEKMFLSLFRRFLWQSDFMLSRLALDRDQRRGWVERWKLALHSGDLLALPRKLDALSRKIDYAVLSNDTPEKVRALAAALQAVAYRISELTEARELPHSELLVQQFRDELRTWREVAQEQLRLWADDPEQAVAAEFDMEGRLAARMARFDARIEEIYRQGEAAELSERDYENFFRYIGGLRGLSESGIGFIRVAQTVDWARWREARF